MVLFDNPLKDCVTCLYGSFYFVCWPQKIWKKLTGKLSKNEFFNRVLAPGTYLDRFLLKNRADSTIQISISIFLDPIRARFAVFLDFSRIFAIQISSGLSIPYRKHTSATPGIILSYRNIPRLNIDLFLPPLIRISSGHSRPAGRPAGPKEKWNFFQGLYPWKMTSKN